MVLLGSLVKILICKCYLVDDVAKSWHIALLRRWGKAEEQPDVSSMGYPPPSGPRIVDGRRFWLWPQHQPLRQAKPCSHSVTAPWTHLDGLPALLFLFPLPTLCFLESPPSETCCTPMSCQALLLHQTQAIFQCKPFRATDIWFLQSCG